MNIGLRVLIVDDSLVFRETLFNELGRFLPEGSVLEKADDSFSARDKILEFKPEVMLLDLEMPKMDGVEFLRRLLPQYPLPTVIMSADPDYCIEALMAGACDFVSKPSSGRSLNDSYLSDIALRLRIASLRKIRLRPYEWRTDRDKPAVESPSTGGVSIRRPSINHKTAADVTERILSKSSVSPEPSQVATSGIRVSPGSVFTALSRRSELSKRQDDTSGRGSYNAGGADLQSEDRTASLTKTEPAGSTAAAYSQISKGPKKISFIAIGASTGGTVALSKVIADLKPPLPPILVVQHIPANFSRLFAERLNDESTLAVKEAKDGDRVERNHVYIAPGGLHMRLVSTANGYRLACAPGKPVNSVCPSVDVLFDSVADLVGNESLGVILTGIGRDGADGLLKMRKAGAATLGQDKKTCVVYGMPKSAWEAGAVQKQLPLESIAGAIMAIVSEYK